MGLFKKKRIETLDLTTPKNKDLLRRSNAIARRHESNETHNGDTLDLTQNKSTPVANAQTPTSNSPFGFLGGLASASDKITPETPTTSYYRNNNPSTTNNTDEGKTYQALTNKLEDIEYKLERALDRINELEKT